MSNPVFDIYDGGGRKIMDLTQQLTRTIGVQQINNDSGTIWVNKQNGERVWAYMLCNGTNILPIGGSGSEYRESPSTIPYDIAINGNAINYRKKNNISWFRNSGFRIVYGVY